MEHLTFGLGLMITSYITFAILVIVLAVRVGRIAALPMQLRWELYPVPHESPEKAEYGGSYHEDPEFWRSPPRRWLLGELKETMKEMLFMIRMFRNNRALWWASYPMHLGFYVILAWFVLLFIGALTEIASQGYVPIQTLVTISPPPIPFVRVGDFVPYPHAWSILIYVMTLGAGYFGAACILYGSFSCLILRRSRPELRYYSSVSDYFNLLFIMAVVVSGCVAACYDPHFIIAREYLRSLLMGGLVLPLEKNMILIGGPWIYVSQPIPAAVAVHVIILEIFLIYFSFTKMIHGLMKYFSYHKVLWDDVPRLPYRPEARKLDEKVMRYLSYVATWSAPHAAPGKKWSEIAVSPVG